MTLRKKALLSISLTGVVLTICLIYICSSLISSDADLSDAQSARLSVKSASTLLASETAALADIAKQYAADAEIRTVLPKKRAAGYLKIRFTEELLERSRINIVLFAVGPGKIIFSTGFDNKGESKSSLLKFLTASPDWQTMFLSADNFPIRHQGLWQVENKIFIFASSPVTARTNPDRISGKIILGRLLDLSLLFQTPGNGYDKFSLHPLAGSKLPAGRQNILNTLNAGSPVYITAVNDSNLAAYSLIKDISGKPGFLLEISSLRTHKQRAETTLLQISFAIIIAFILLASFCYFFLAGFFLSGVEKIQTQIKSIIASGMANNRIEYKGKDELASMSGNINTLLAKMEQKQQEIGDVAKFNRRITDNMLDMVIQIDLNGTYQYVSPSHKNVLGHPAEKLIGKSVFDIIYDHDLKNVLLLLRKHVMQGSPIRFECRAHHSAGRYVWLDAFANPLYDDNRKLVGAVIVARDITVYKKALEEVRTIHASLEDRIADRTQELTAVNNVLIEEIMEREKIEQAVQKSRNMLRAVFDGISDPLIMVSDSFIILMINEAALKYFGGASYQAMIGTSCREAFVRANYDEEALQKIIVSTTRKEASSLEFQRLPPFPKFEKLFIYPVALKNISGGEAIIRISDLTKAKLAERQLVQGEKLASLGMLISGIAHEINNPNNFIIFNIPILTDYLKEIMPIVDDYALQHRDYELFGMTYNEFREDIFKLLNNIHHGAERINSTVSKLREFSRKKEINEQRWVNPKELIEKAVSICQIQINKTVRKFSLDLEEGMPDIYTDANGLEQVLINLVINSTQAMDKRESALSIRAKATPDWQEKIIIEIEDNGCGMDETTKTNIFDPFFTTKPYGMGTGLGLYISKNIMESLGGRIEIESVSGEGTKARIILADTISSPSDKP